MDQWLVRTAQNWIAGPYPKDQVCQMILEGKLTSQDEVCGGQGYWFFIHESSEVKSQLGLEYPPKESIDGSSETKQINYAAEDEEATDPDLQVGEGEFPELEDISSTPPDSTAVIDTTKFRKQKEGARPQTTQAPSQASGQAPVQTIDEETPKRPAWDKGPMRALPRVEIKGAVHHENIFWQKFGWIFLMLLGALISMSLLYLKRRLHHP